MWTGHFGGRKWSVRVILALYILSVLWMKIPAVRSLPLTGFNHLLILHHNLGTHHRFAVTGITLLLFAIIITVTVRFGWRGRISLPRPRVSGMTACYLRELAARQKLLALFAVVLVITLYKAGAGFRLQSGQEWVYSLFAGHGTGCFRVFPFLEMLIGNGAPLYLLAAFLEWTASGQSYFISVRAESRRKMLRGILWAGTGFLAAYALLWFAAGFFGIFFFGYADGITAWKMLLYAVIMKFLDTMGQYLVMLYCFKTGYNRFSGAGCGKAALCCAPAMGILSALRPFGPDTDCGIEFRRRTPCRSGTGDGGCCYHAGSWVALDIRQ